MRSKKNLVIGFLLLFLGIGLSEYSLPLSILAGVAGIVMMILYAAGKLKRNTSEIQLFARDFWVQRVFPGRCAVNKHAG